ncbi:WPE palindromic element domain-containing protein [Wolbachia endosymbiont (group A) of Anomoia purmunda]|uniref:WPE palindromic element domain-containing protein n=1 Tax=Wolbachia endosymbiont (group A) of Anomoia purmunda TaxID=2953978 RepID=UPI002230629F|nr:WPE palindromic element domain-containing protein [Wolbachia endosymbiont (group A) of Anomoia purmunda]
MKVADYLDPENLTSNKWLHNKGWIPVLDTGIQTLIVILVNKSGENKRSSQNAVFLLK